MTHAPKLSKKVDQYGRLSWRAMSTAEQDGFPRATLPYFFFEHYLIRPSFARRSGLREGGKPVPTFSGSCFK
jgi:hypothetical protein